jgi:hypothetical protein
LKKWEIVHDESADHSRTEELMTKSFVRRNLP